MTDLSVQKLSFFHVLVACFLGATLILIFYVKKLFDQNATRKSAPKSNSKTKAQTPKESVVKASNKKGKAVQGVENRWGGRGDKAQAFSHPWLLTSLKGHTGQVLDVDYSSDGKFLASCGEDALDPGGETTTGSGSDSSPKEEDDDQSSRSSSVGPRKTTPLTRRQRKNRRPREVNTSSSSSNSSSSPEVSKKKRGADSRRRQQRQVILPKMAQLQVSQAQLYLLMREYLLLTVDLVDIGYPVESAFYPGRAIIYKHPVHHFVPRVTQFDVNAREFVPRINLSVEKINKLNSDVGKEKYIDAKWSAGHDNMSGDSGQGSGTSSPLSGESDAGDSVLIQDNDRSSEERRCARCSRGFLIASGGEYITQEGCLYHWGRLQYFDGHAKMLYQCCLKDRATVGCTKGRLHVWNGLELGFNGPLEGYVRTKPRKTPPPDGNYGVYALDCEMCYTCHGLELAKITVIGSDGRLVYDSYVRPVNEIIDYNTRFSGITAKDLNGHKSSAKTLREVQNDLMGFINADTILIGHGLENDLRALKIIHSTIIDTAVTFPHYNGLPYRRSLRSLASCLLKKDIQCSSSGHNSLEDARACMELMLWRVRRDHSVALMTN